MARKSRQRSSEQELVIHEKMSLLFLIPILACFVFSFFFLLIGALSRDILKGFLCGGGTFLFGLLAGAALFFAGNLGKRRLVLERKALLLQTGSDNVIGQIPYDNIASLVTAERIEWDRRGREIRRYQVLELNLLRDDDDDTWWTEVDRGDSCNYEIRPRYRLPLSRIRRLILDRVEPLLRAKRDARGI
jgi:hypothetical protein